MTRNIKNALQNEDGSSTIEFVVVFLGFMSLLMFVIELTIYQFSIASLEKAAEAGVRFAVVSAPAATGVSRTNDLDEAEFSNRWGESCDPEGGSCAAFSPSTCVGETMTNCRGSALNAIVARMRQFNGSIRRQNVTVSYRNTGIGFAGGPSAPMVTVSISGVQVSTGIFGLLLGDSATGLRTLPVRTATMTGEDLQ